MMRLTAKSFAKQVLCEGLLRTVGPVARRFSRKAESEGAFQEHLQDMRACAGQQNEPLNVRTFHDVVFDPRYNALYSRCGELLASTALTRHESVRRIGAPDRIDIDLGSCRALPEAVYGGTLFDNHWGHLLMESLSRLWPLVEPPDKLRGLSNLPWLFRQSSTRNEAVGGKLPDLLNAIEGMQQRALLPDAPIRIDTIHVPDRSSVIGRYAAAEFGRLGAHIGAKILGTAARRESFEGRKLYLSRRALPATKRRILGEAELEGALAAKGFESIYPEHLSLPDQIALFSEAKVIVGCIGSAFHTQLLSPTKPAPALYLCPARPSVTYMIIDRLKSTPNRYVHALHDTAFSGRYFLHQNVDIAAVLNCGLGADFDGS